ncbi:hypothetical protein B0T10DRAFT_573652 [Thelonectria olida]|uniref:Uncharacterized protein n=1 Tax=Thelonectria olida TaxID=1576542 RepID=A0A9P9AHJ7_9HYPO|nr:hypothetical protein B0T10DRAFT_573652 [Thelonectria olida]
MRPIFIAQILFSHLGLGLALTDRDSNGIFFPPKLSSFIQLDIAVSFPANVSTPDGMVALAPNVEGGRVTGAFEAEIVPVGAGFERVALNDQGENSFYQNKYILKTANNDTFTLDVDGILHYENSAIHGFGIGKFATTAPEFMHINYEVYVFEVQSGYGTGRAFGEVFAITPCGRRDGQPIPALLPPGAA